MVNSDGCGGLGILNSAVVAGLNVAEAIAGGLVGGM